MEGSKKEREGISVKKGFMMDKLALPTPNPESFISHYGQTGTGRIWPLPAKLTIVTALSNPRRWHSRYHNYWKFAKHMADSGVDLITVELAYGERAFEVTEPGRQDHVQLRAPNGGELWHKENLLNLGIQRLPQGIKYFGWCDADFMFTRSDWAQETLQQLQHYDAVQPFSSYSNLDSNFQTECPMLSFTYNFVNNGGVIPTGGYGYGGYGGVGAVGGAWCYRTEAFSTIGTLLDVCILGSGDWHMAMGLAKKPDQHLDMRGSPDYVRAIRNWQTNAQKLKGNIGYVNCHAIHHWHGNKKNRKYVDRAKILIDNQYSPLTDIQRDWQGVYELSGNKPKLRDDIRAYFLSRKEDDLT